MKKKTLRADLVLIAALLLAAGLLYLALNAGRSSGGWAVVRVDGEVTARYPLGENGSFSLNGGSNTLVIEDGQAWISEANCPDKLCMGFGKIRYSGQVITCLPNRLTVTVEGGQDDGVDIVVN